MDARIGHWIAGSQHVSGTATTLPVVDPATGQHRACVELATAELVDDAVQDAVGAAATWGVTSLSRRVEVLFRFRELLASRAEELAELITAEHGKVHEDALGEVKRGLEVVELACGLPNLLKGGYTQGASTGVDVYSLRQPLGVVTVVAPFNFPAMVPLWFVPLAIATGNAVVLKPSEQVPSTAVWLAERFSEAGLPPGVLNVVQGDKVAVDALIEHRDVAAISFVGSTPVARHVYANGSRSGKRVQALGGAKNHMLVLPDADLDLAADSAVNAGFGSAGERCMAISEIVAVDTIADDLVDRIRERMAQLRTGDGRRGCDMGPLISEAHRDRVLGYIEAGIQSGATLAVDGRDVDDVDGDPAGYWLRPTLFDHVTTDMSIYTDEIFGPVLGVLRVGSFDDGVDLINANPYGNGTAIFTRSGAAARRFQEQIEVGMVGVNVPIPVPMAYYSFGGWKSSLYGDARAYGDHGAQFFTREKVVTSRWPDAGRGGIDLGFPTER